jgi:hypothetical protein
MPPSNAQAQPLRRVQEAPFLGSRSFETRCPTSAPGTTRSRPVWAILQAPVPDTPLFVTRCPTPAPGTTRWPAATAIIEPATARLLGRLNRIVEPAMVADNGPRKRPGSAGRAGNSLVRSSGRERQPVQGPPGRRVVVRQPRSRSALRWQGHSWSGRSHLQRPQSSPVDLDPLVDRGDASRASSPSAGRHDDAFDERCDDEPLVLH